MTQVEGVIDKASSLGHTEDVSEGGLRVTTSETFDPPTKVTVRFNLPPNPPGHPIESEGEVVRTQPGKEMGIKVCQSSSCLLT